MSNFKIPNGTSYGEYIFIRIVRLAEKERDLKFLKGEELLKLGNYLGVSFRGCKLVQERYKKRYT